MMQGIWHKNNKLLAAISTDDVPAPRMVHKEICKGLQDHISAFVAIVIIELFEIIQIHHHNGYRQFFTPCSSDLVVEKFNHIATVVNICERIFDCLLLQFITEQLDLLQ